MVRSRRQLFGGGGGLVFLLWCGTFGNLGWWMRLNICDGAAMVLLNNTLGKAHDYETFSIYFIVNALSRSLL